MGNIISSNTSNIIYNKVVFWSKSLSILPFYKFVVTKTLQKLQVQRPSGSFGTLLRTMVHRRITPQALLHETRSELRFEISHRSKISLRCKITSLSAFAWLRTKLNYFGANFASVNLTKVKFQTAVNFPCKQKLPAVK